MIANQNTPVARCWTTRSHKRSKTLVIPSPKLLPPRWAKWSGPPSRRADPQRRWSGPGLWESRLKHHMEVSWNMGTHKSSILIGFCITNQPFWGYPHLWNPPYFLGESQHWTTIYDFAMYRGFDQWPYGLGQHLVCQIFIDSCPKLWSCNLIGMDPFPHAQIL